MSPSADRVLAEALGLPMQARAYVAEKLIESLDASPGTELSSTWREKTRRRCREIDEGAVELKDAGEVFDRAYSSLE